MTVSIKDISRLAKVSTATVSRVLNDQPGVSAQQRKRIRQLADSLGYQPNRFAQNLVRGQSRLVGFVISELGNSDYVYYYRRIEDALAARGYQCLISDSRLDPAKEKQNIEVMLQNRVEGLVILPSLDPRADEAQAVFADLKRRKIPFVLLGAPAGEGIDWVAIEACASAAALTQRLLDLGHQRLGVIGLDPANPAERDQLDGIHQALARAGLAEAALRMESSSEPGWENVVRQWLAEPAPPTALLTATDDMAALLYRHLRRWGKSVPQDLSIAALTASTWAGLLDPPVMANWPDHKRIPDLAAELLARRMDQPDAPAEGRRVPMRLSEGASCAPAKQ
jgi:LacI family transcriptional regulator